MPKKADLDHVCKTLSSLEAPLDIIFHAGEEESPFGSELAKAAAGIEGEAGGVVTVKQGDGTGLVASPGLTLSSRGQQNINYLIVPEGLEAPPFLEALLGLSQGVAGPTEELARQLKGLERPAELLVFVAPTCPHCPKAAQAANRIAVASPQVTTSVIDVQQFPALAERFKVKSVPLTILDENLFLTGVVQARELAEQILSRGSEEFDAHLFLTLVEEGRVSEAADQIRDGRGLAHFLSAWKKSTTSLRMGLLLISEEVLDEDRSAMDGIVDELINELGSFDAAHRGDTADLLGRIGHTSAKEALGDLRGDSNPDVAEIASEALEEIEDRGGS